MIAGILSDSHGDAGATARAVALLESRGAKRLYHCGDVCAESVLDELAGHDARFVWGNCDVVTPALRKYVTALGLPWPEVPVRDTVGGKRIAVFHGHERAFRDAAALDVDYVFYGHTHQRADHAENGVRFINPGALYRASVHTVALLNVATGWLRFLRIDSGREVPGQ